MAFVTVFIHFSFSKKYDFLLPQEVTLLKKKCDKSYNKCHCLMVKHIPFVKPLSCFSGSNGYGRIAMPNTYAV